MLKRTITLVGLTITLGALLLALGCSGSNNNPIADQNTDTPSRVLGNAQVSFAANPHPTVTVEDSDGIKIIYLQWLVNGNAYRKTFYPGGVTLFQFVLPDWGKASYHTFAVVDNSGMRDSRWAITQDGRVIRIR